MESVPGHICPCPTLVQEHLHPDQPLIGSNLYLSSPLSLARVSQGESSAHSHFTDEATEACREVQAHQRSLRAEVVQVRIGVADLSRSGFATSHPAPFSPGLPFLPWECPSSLLLQLPPLLSSSFPEFFQGFPWPAIWPTRLSFWTLREELWRSS